MWEKYRVCTTMGHLQDCSSLHDPPGRASSLGRPNPVSYPVSYVHVIMMVCCQGTYLPGFVMACELFATKYRTFAGTMIGNAWAIAMCLYALLAYLVRNWVHIQLIISLFGLLTIPLYW